MGERYGHKTLIDGSHVPLTEDEAAALWKLVEDAKDKRAVDMPTARDALSVLIDAKQRLNELGWWQGGGLRVRRGDECAVAETGSTGMWRGHVDAEGEFVQFGDYSQKPRNVWLKPLSDLTPEERAWMDECDRREARAYDAMLSRLPQQEPEPHD